MCGLSASIRHVPLCGILKHKAIVNQKRTNQQPLPTWPPISAISNFFTHEFCGETRVVIHWDDIKVTPEWLAYFKNCHRQRFGSHSGK